MRWIDADAGDAPGADNRGLAYGDGVFETLRVTAQRIRFLGAHLERLSRGCERLGIRAPDRSRLSDLLQQRARERQDGWLKLIVTRGDTPRGYASDDAGETCCIISSGTLAPAPAAWRVMLCRTALPTDPALAGIKHLNRLPQVLARREWRGSDFDEGIMCDADGHVACGIMSNVFIVREQQIVTPRIESCGVAGVMRDWVIANADVAVRAINLAELLSADEVFLTNALRGVMPVAAIGRQRLAADPPVTQALKRRLAGQAA